MKYHIKEVWEALGKPKEFTIAFGIFTLTAKSFENAKRTGLDVKVKNDRDMLLAEASVHTEPIDYFASFIDTAVGTIKNSKNKQGTMECPRCGNELQYSVSDVNGHTMGICKTENCLRWIE